LVGVAAGMAMEGRIVYLNTIATFLSRRCYEQVAVDLCLHGMNVRLIANGGGVVYAPLGPTHLAIEDIAIMRALPNMTVVARADLHPRGEGARPGRYGRRRAVRDWQGGVDARGQRRAHRDHRRRLAGRARRGGAAGPVRRQRRGPAFPDGQAARYRGPPCSCG